MVTHPSTNRAQCRVTTLIRVTTVNYPQYISIAYLQIYRLLYFLSGNDVADWCEILHDGRAASQMCLLLFWCFHAGLKRALGGSFLAFQTPIFSQPSIYIDSWLYGMRMTSVVCNVPVLSQNDSTYHHSVFTA